MRRRRNSWRDPTRLLLAMCPEKADDQRTGDWSKAVTTSTLARPEPSFEEAARMRAFWCEHRDALLEKYPEQFVAVSERTVVAANSDLFMLVHQLREMGLSPRTDVAIELISSHSGSLLL